MALIPKFYMDAVVSIGIRNGVSISQFEMSGHSLLRRIRRLTGWTDERPRMVYGTFIASHNAIVFDLTTAEPTDLELVPGGTGMTC